MGLATWRLCLSRRAVVVGNGAERLSHRPFLLTLGGLAINNVIAMSLPVIPAPPPWYAGGLSFTCTCCGNCCTGAPGFVWISEEEVDRLAEHLKLSRDQTLERYCRKIGSRISLKERRTPQGNYDCIFLVELPPEKEKEGQVAHSRRVCGIYAVRPLQSRTWPIWWG